MDENTTPDHDLDATARRLRENRPQLGEQGMRRLRARTAGTTRRRGGRSALAAMVLTLGVLVTGTGTGFAVSGLGSSGVSSQAQYQGVGGESQTNSGKGADSGTLGEEQSNDSGAGGNTADDQVLPQTEAASESSSLPFTGWSAIPVIVLGVALLAGGFVLRSRAGSVRGR